jgi:hypothetical protein
LENFGAFVTAALEPPFYLRRCISCGFGCRYPWVLCAAFSPVSGAVVLVLEFSVSAALDAAVSDGFWHC